MDWVKQEYIIKYKGSLSRYNECLYWSFTIGNYQRYLKNIIADLESTVLGMMMKRLILIRHAQADHSIGLRDFERPLNVKGEGAGAEMGAVIAKRRIVIDRIFSSPAKRALSTAVLIGKALGWEEGEIITPPALYTFESEALFRFIEALDNSLSSVVIVGHNPAMTFLVNDLTHFVIDNLPPGAVASIELEIVEWVDIRLGCGKLLWLEFPQNH